MSEKSTIDPAEEWLFSQWLGDQFFVMRPKEARTETKKRILAHIYNLQESSNNVTPPFDPRVLFEDRKILSLNYGVLPFGKEAALTPVNGGFVISIDKQKSKNIRHERFSIAHEIGHTFFFDLNSKMPKLRFDSARAKSSVQEGYSSEIAGAILVPDTSLSSYVKTLDLEPSISNLHHLRRVFHVSLEAIRKRLMSLGIWDCISFQSKCTSPNAEIITKLVIRGSSFKKRQWTIPKKLTLSDTRTEMRRSLYPVLTSIHSGNATAKEINVNGMVLVFESTYINKENCYDALNLITAKKPENAMQRFL